MRSGSTGIGNARDHPAPAAPFAPIFSSRLVLFSLPGVALSLPPAFGFAGFEGLANLPLGIVRMIGRRGRLPASGCRRDAGRAGGFGDCARGLRSGGIVGDACGCALIVAGALDCSGSATACISPRSGRVRGFGGNWPATLSRSPQARARPRRDPAPAAAMPHDMRVIGLSSSAARLSARAVIWSCVVRSEIQSPAVAARKKVATVAEIKSRRSGNISVRNPIQFAG